MKSYIYTRNEGRHDPHSSGTPYTVKLYRVIRGSPVFVGKDTDKFCSDFQQCRDLMIRLKLWPKAADAVGPDGHKLYYYPDQLRAAKIININQI